ncbi:RES family NAD+ phosphorylase [Paenibacillus sp. T2-29]
MTEKNDYVVYKGAANTQDGQQSYSDLAMTMRVTHDKEVTQIWNDYVGNLKKLLEEFFPYIATLNISSHDGPYFRGRAEKEDKQPYYKAKDLKAPPAQWCGVGRVNPAGLPFLYIADSIETVLQEVHKKSGTSVSIAECKPNQDLKLLDLTHGVEEYSKSNSFRKIINDSFAAPIDYNKPEIDYLPTQAIALYVKDFMKLDGIKYKSAVHDGGYNLVLFDDSVINVSYSQSRLVP